MYKTNKISTSNYADNNFGMKLTYLKITKVIYFKLSTNITLSRKIKNIC